MLAVFDKSVAQSPDALQSPHSDSVSALKDGFLACHFASVHPSAVTISLGTSGIMAYSLERQNPLLPRYYYYFFFLGILPKIKNDPEKKYTN